VRAATAPPRRPRRMASALRGASRLGDLDGLLSCLDRGADVNGGDVPDHYASPLYVASIRGPRRGGDAPTRPRRPRDAPQGDTGSLYVSCAEGHT